MDIKTACSNVTDFHRISKCLQRECGVILARKKLLPYITLIVQFNQGLHDRTVVDLLPPSQFESPRHTSRVHIADVVDELAQPHHYIAVHNLNMIDVEEHLHPFRADTFDQLDAPIHVVAHITWMAFHFDVHTAIEHLKTKIDLLRLSVSNDLFESLDAMIHALFVGD